MTQCITYNVKSTLWCSMSIGQWWPFLYSRVVFLSSCIWQLRLSNRVVLEVYCMFSCYPPVPVSYPEWDLATVVLCTLWDFCDTSAFHTVNMPNTVASRNVINNLDKHLQMYQFHTGKQFRTMWEVFLWYITSRHYKNMRMRLVKEMLDKIGATLETLPTKPAWQMQQQIGMSLFLP